MQAVLVSKFGGPRALTPSEVERPTAGSGQILVEVTVSGVNFLDVLQRTGATPLQAPFIAGKAWALWWRSARASAISPWDSGSGG